MRFQYRQYYSAGEFEKLKTGDSTTEWFLGVLSWAPIDWLLPRVHFYRLALAKNTFMRPDTTTTADGLKMGEIVVHLQP